MALEDMSPEQMMAALWLVLAIVSIFVFGRLVCAIIYWRTAKYLQFKVEQEVVKNIVEKTMQPSLFNRIRLWWKERKAKKDLYSPYEIPKKFREG